VIHLKKSFESKLSPKKKNRLIKQALQSAPYKVAKVTVFGSLFLTLS